MKSEARELIHLTSDLTTISVMDNMIEFADKAIHEDSVVYAKLAITNFETGKRRSLPELPFEKNEEKDTNTKEKKDGEN